MTEGVERNGKSHPLQALHLSIHNLTMRATERTHLHA